MSDIERLHPGIVLGSMLEIEGMSQKELAIRTGTSEKHISTVIRGKKNISLSFAKKLEFALSEPMDYWLGLQAKYDVALYDFEEKHGIDEEELHVLTYLKDISAFLQKVNLIGNATDDPDLVLKLRKIMGVSSLKAIPEISYNGVYRAQVNNNVNVNPYVLYAWKRICEVSVSKIEIHEVLNTELLKAKLADIKKLMFESISYVNSELSKILAECGIAFRIVPHFRGAPVQGFISKRADDRLMLCLTLRQKRADKFWFTLFHEIGHILNGDVSLKFIDFDSIKNEAEEAADLFAGNVLLNKNEYKTFWENNDFSLASIKSFAASQNVRPYIVIGRLQMEGELDWSAYPNEMVYYEWATGTV